VQKVLRDPAACIQNILDSTRAVLELAVPGMYFSTSEVYGKTLGASPMWKVGTSLTHNLKFGLP
jgi:hypothetical protein